MGKTEKGAVWLDPTKTSPYDYYQFWINTDDRDVERFLALFTFLEMEDIKEYGKLRGAEIRKAKEVLAFEATKIVHGEEEAEKARDASKVLFAEEVNAKGDAIPTTYVEKERVIEGIPVFKLFELAGLSKSNSEARRLILQGGGYLNKKRIERYDQVVSLRDFNDKGEILLRAGKKKFHRVKLFENKE